MQAPGLVSPIYQQGGPEVAPEEPQTVYVVPCPRDRVGRVIGRGGETIKALQLFSGATIQIDQSKEPTEITLLGSSGAVSLAQSMIEDIINGAFKGFAMLRQTAFMLNDPLAPSFDPPLYVPRYGFVARNQIETPQGMQPSVFPMGPPPPLMAPLTPEKRPGWLPRAPPAPMPSRHPYAGPSSGVSPGRGGSLQGIPGAAPSIPPEQVLTIPRAQAVSREEESLVSVSNASSLSEMVAALHLQSEPAPIGSPQSPASSRHVEPGKGAVRSEGALPQVDPGAGWVQVANPDGRIFYHNPQTGESRWE